VKFKMQIDGAEHEVEAGADGRIVLGGHVCETMVTASSEGRRVVQSGEKTYEVRIVEDCADTGIFVLELAGERIPVTVSEVARRAAGAPVDAPQAAAAVSALPGVAAVAGPSAPAAPGTGPAAPAVEAGPSAGGTGAAGSPSAASEDVREGIWAPVPGKIVDVFVKVGDTVKEGDVVLVLEAMKMENELRAPATGTVTAVTVKKGDQAERGQLLVALE